MALVKCTKQVFQHVNEQIDRLFSARLSEAFKIRGMTELEIANKIYDLTHTPERVKILEEIQSTYEGPQLVFRSNTMRFRLPNKNTSKRSFEVQLSREKPLVHAFMTQYGEVAFIKDAPPEVLTAVLEAQDRYDAVKKDQQAFKEAFNEAWKKVKSVNELLKAWPAVSDLLPSDVITRVNRKSGPRIKKEETFDAAALNVQLLKAKVAK